MEPQPFARHWWAILLRGLVAIGFSVVAWARPGPTLAVLVVLFGAYAIGDGVVALAGAFRAGRREESWWLMAIEGLFGLALGVYTLTMPARALTIAFLVIGLWALCTGVLELIEAGRLRRLIPGEWLLMLSGLVRIVFGVVLMTQPGAAMLTLLWIAAGYALVDGIILVALSLRLRRHAVGRREAGAGPMTLHPA
jgi:uncharacterized membrane protein HdeD (DUF308 family)